MALHIQSSIKSVRTPRGASRARPTVVASAVSQPAADAAAPPRRQALLYGLAFAAAAAASAAAPRPAAALTTAGTVCSDKDTAEAGDECRRALLLKDGGAEKVTGEYSKVSSERAAKPASNVPVSVIDAKYAAATLALAASIEGYLGQTTYDKSLPARVKALRAESQAWVSKYAPGGSVRKQSARSLYVAVDAVAGHLASNGFAPFPASKAALVRGSIETAKAFLDEAK